MNEEAGRLGKEVNSALNHINRAWLGREPGSMREAIDADVIFAHPGFGKRVRGAAAFLAGFEEFCASAQVISFRETERQVDVISDLAVATLRFDLVCRRSDGCFRSTDRDLWVSRRNAGVWSAAWRTMLDFGEELVFPDPGQETNSG